MKKKILVLIPVNEAHKKLLESKAPGSEFIYATPEAVDVEQVRNANIIVGSPDVNMIKDSKNLKLLQLQSAGVGIYAEENVLPEGVILCNASGAYGLGISEYMLGVVLELFKKLHLYRDNQAEASWKYKGQVKSVYNSTALIIGAGDIGSEFAVRMKALGAYTIGIRRTDKDKPDCFDEVYKMDSLETLLPRADVVALSLPETKHTIKVINEKTLKLMKQDAVLINVGRGSAVDTEALCDALEKRYIFGAALDVTDPEPLPKEHRLWKLKNAVITPHVSGGYSLQETHDRIVKISSENIEAYINGVSIKKIVNRKAGY